MYFPETVAVDLARYPTLGELRTAMGDAGFVQLEEQTVEFAGELKVCFDPEGKKRPTEFKSASGSQTFVAVHKRVKK